MKQNYMIPEAEAFSVRLEENLLLSDGKDDPKGEAKEGGIESYDNPEKDNVEY